MRKGIAVSPGVVVGTAYCIHAIFIDPDTKRLEDNEVTAELAAYETARDRTAADLRALQSKVEKQLGHDEAAIFAVHEAIRRYGKHCWEHEVREDHKAIAPIAAHIADPARQSQFVHWAEEHLWEWEGLYGTQADPFELYLQTQLPEGLGTFQGHLDYVRVLPSDVDPSKRKVLNRDWKGGHRKGKVPPIMPPQQQWQAFLIARNVDCDFIESELEFIGSGWVWPGPDLMDVEDGWVLMQHEAEAVEADIVLIVKDIVAAIDLYERVYDEAAAEDPARIEASRRRAADTAFPCVPGDHCYGGDNTEMWCPYSGLCPAFQLSETYTVGTQDPLPVSKPG